MWPLPKGFRLFDREVPLRGAATQPFIDLELGAMSPTRRALLHDDDDRFDARSSSTSASWVTRHGRVVPRSLVTDALRDTTVHMFDSSCSDILAGPVTRRFYEDAFAARRDEHAQAHKAAAFRRRAHAVVAFARRYDWRGAHPELAQVHRALVAQRHMGHPDVYVHIDATRLVLGADGLGIAVQRVQTWHTPSHGPTGGLAIPTYEQLALAVGLVHTIDVHTAAWARALGHAAAQVRGTTDTLTGAAPLGAEDTVLPLSDEAPHPWSRPQMWAAPCVVGLGVGLGTGSLCSGVMATGAVWAIEAAGFAIAHRALALRAWRTLCTTDGCEDEGYGSVSDISDISAPDYAHADALDAQEDMRRPQDPIEAASPAWPCVEKPLLRIDGAPS